MKRLIVLSLIFCLSTTVSFAQEPCENCGVCNELFNKDVRNLEINTESDNFHQLDLEICESYLFEVDIENIEPNISFIEKYFPIENYETVNLQLCKDDIENCLFFIARNEDEITEFAPESKDMIENTMLIAEDLEVLYILQKDAENCRVFELNIIPIEQNVDFEIEIDDVNVTQKEICPREIIELNVNFKNEEEDDDYTFQWTRNGTVLGSNSSTLTIDTIGTYKVVVTSKDSSCFAEDSISVSYADTLPEPRYFRFMDQNYDADEDIIFACIDQEITIEAVPSNVNAVSNYSWELNSTIEDEFLIFSSPDADTINSTISLTSKANGCTGIYNLPTIKIFEPPTISVENDLAIVQPKNCKDFGTVTIKRSDTTIISYELCKEDICVEPDSVFVVEPDTMFVFEKVEIGSIYTIVTDNGICTAKSDTFKIESTGTATTVDFMVTSIVDVDTTEITLNQTKDTLEVCTGTKINFEILNSEDTIQNLDWDPDLPFTVPTDSSINKFSVKLTYEYIVNEDGGFCLNETVIPFKINQPPTPTVVLTVDGYPVIDNTICIEETLTLSTQENYDEFDWEFNESDSTLNSIEYIPENDDPFNYTLIVTDNNGCKSEPVEGEIIIEDGEQNAVQIQEVYPAPSNSTNTTKTFCKGSNAIYKYESQYEYEFNITFLGDNKIRTHINGKDKFIIVEWNTPADLTLKASSNTSTSRCAGNEIPIMIDGTAPIGSIERFGNSSTFIVNHTNENVDSIQWFTLDENGTYSPISQATERIIDCESINTDFNFDCDFLDDSDNETKLLGVKLSTGQCSNIIFFNNEQELLQELLITPVYELSINNNLFNVNPNINQGEFYITFKSKKPQTQYHLSVYNISGETVYNAEIKQANSSLISVSPASPGYYLAVIKDGGQPIAQQKLIIY